VREKSDPGADFVLRAEGYLCAAVVGWATEESGEGVGEGGGACAGETGADDAEFGSWDGVGWCLAHVEVRMGMVGMRVESDWKSWMRME